MTRAAAILVTLLLAMTTLPAGDLDGDGAAPPFVSTDVVLSSRGNGTAPAPFLSYTTTVQVRPGDDFFVVFDMEEGTLEGKRPPPLPDECEQAVQMAPEWLREDLINKFRQVGGEDRVDLANTIIESPVPELVDEIAFVAAHLAAENIRDDNFFFELITHNAQLIYDADQYLPYVKIVEREDYTTLKYRDRDDRWVELDRDIYYWYVVHPKLSDELPTYVDPDYDFTSDPPFDRNYGVPPPEGKYWRDWLFYENDTGGYPILRERLSGAGNIWEAIGACNGWMGGSMSFTSDNERPIQPVRIYRKHIGRCGEYQDMRNAIARAGLIPSTCTLNSAEDHVWNEFWDGRWIHWDGDTDNPRKYESGWGKTISSVWNTRGDGHIWSVAKKYTDICNFTAEVLDGDGMPVDGALVRISTENFYNPELMTTTTWGTTDYTGSVVIPLGDGRNYWAEADTNDLGDDPWNGEEEVIVDSSAWAEYSYTFEVPFSAPALRVEDAPLPGTDDGPYRIEVDYTVEENILRVDNAYTGEHGDLRGPGGDTDFFIADSGEFNMYRNDRTFEAWHYAGRSGGGSVGFVPPSQDNYYVVVSNGFSQATTKFINVTVRLYADLAVGFYYPEDGTESDIGGTMWFKGVAWSPLGVDLVEFQLDGSGNWSTVEDIDPDDPYRDWIFPINTTQAGPGDHVVTARAWDARGYLTDSLNFSLADRTAPTVSIEQPGHKTFHEEGDLITVAGTAADNICVVSLLLWVDEGTADAVNITYTIEDGLWSYDLAAGGMDYGTHNINVAASDGSGNGAETWVSVIIVEGEPPTVAIKSPREGSLHGAGDTIVVKGTAEDNSKLSALELSFDGDEPVDITSSIADDGSWEYLWESPATLSADGEHVITAVAYDSFGSQASDDVTVILDAEGPDAGFTSPGAGEIFRAGGELEMTGIATDAGGIGMVGLSFDGDAPVDITKKVWEGEWSYDDWDTRRVGSGEHTVTLTVTDTVGHEATDTLTLIIDAEGPVATLLGMDEPVQWGEWLALRGAASDDIGVAQVLIEVGSSAPVDITDRLKGDDWSYNVNTGDLVPGRYTVRLTVTDVVGNTADEDITFEVAGDDGAGGEDGGDGSGGDGDDTGGSGEFIAGSGGDVSGLEAILMVVAALFLLMLIAMAVFRGKRK